jgi:hypothetical protein
MLGQPGHFKRKHLEEHGHPAWGTVLEIAHKGMSVTSGGGQLVSDTEVVYKTKLRVEPERGEPSFEWAGRLRYGQMSVPPVGFRVRVKFDPDDHEDLMIDHSQGLTLSPQPDAVDTSADVSGGGADLGSILGMVQQARQESGGDRTAMAEQLMRQLGGNATVVVGGQVAGGVPTQVDPVAQLEKLADLRDRGVLTPEDVDTQKKKKLLGEAKT